MADQHAKRLTFSDIDSTNAEALRQAANGEQGPIWIDAETQHAGRGRLGRNWVSLSGNLHTSYLFQPDAPLPALAGLSLVSGIALFDAIADCLGGVPDVCQLKWPNDVLLDGAKVAGILIESSNVNGKVLVVIGFGVNVTAAPDHIEAPTTTLAVLRDVPPSIDDVRLALSRQLGHWIGVWNGGRGFGEIRSAWLERGPDLGTPLTVKRSNDMQSGPFAGLDSQGGLLVQDSTGAINCFTFGDVSVVAGEQH